MTCTEFLSRMTEYFDGEVSEQLGAEINAHLAKCEHCEVVVNTTRQTIQVYRDQQVYELSEPLRERMLASIMEKCKKIRCK